MGKLVVSLDGVVIKDVQITKDKTTLGRRPYNDIVIDNLAVSGEHAVLQMLGNDVFIEDLNSTNGTYINGKAVKKQMLVHNDTVEVGKYKIKYLVEDNGDYEKTMIMRPGAAGGALALQPDFADAQSAAHGSGCAAAGQRGGGGVDQGTQWCSSWPVRHAHQGGDHRGQARRAGGVHHQAPLRLCAGPCGRCAAAQHQRGATGHRDRAAVQRRLDRAGGHADAVRARLKPVG